MSKSSVLSGHGAEQFAIENGLDTVSPDWFFTQERWNSLQKALEREKEHRMGRFFSFLSIFIKFAT
ncbi:MAG: isoaspartyl peptidase/L-asparaginase [Thermoanaerobaculia bacterium]|nr:isoaspartyl peptidase/L-asparaginase [Thermoanaerobaculia bacterium]